MKHTKSIAVGGLVVLLAVGVVATQAAVPGVTAQQTEDDGPTGLVVDSLEAPEAAGQDQNVTVEAQITNTDDEELTETVEFRLDGTVADRESVTLAPGETTNVSLSANTEETEPGEVIHGVFTPSDGQLATLTIEESFVIEAFDPPEEAQSGELLTITADIQNPNDLNATQNVTFRLEGETIDAEEVTIEGGETTAVNFTLPTDGVEPGVYTHSVFTRDFGQFAELNVTAEPGETVTPDNDTVDNETTVTPEDDATTPEGDDATPAGVNTLEEDDVPGTPGEGVPPEELTDNETETETATEENETETETATEETETATEATP